jgi:hypothetical protein
MERIAQLEVGPRRAVVPRQLEHRGQIGWMELNQVRSTAGQEFREGPEHAVLLKAKE